ncbi:WUSCHEL-related homeobox 11 isoform X2 [Medicago truncatula]|uniref:WUSCHEL-related homeobox 11 isoform X2 n=1 Tax=Medicago truncatula TaxID=3880 RepID=UPI000D2F2B01|nr:WUSCHEL-related homeobox 11 isoform X2 [Medicago truncatula]
MEDQQQNQHVQSQSSNTNNPNNTEKSETVRSRWTPKPEQILILESIFNSGMVNPPKDETVRIRKLLEKFGAVGDANVFYWFQNRRSRSRRRQRQMQAAAQLGGGSTNANPYHQYQCSTNSTSLSLGTALGFGGSSTFTMNSSSCSTYNNNFSGSSSSCAGGVGAGAGVGVGLGLGAGAGGEEGFGGLYLGSTQINLPQMENTSAASSIMQPSDHASNFNYYPGYGGSNVSGVITVFINGVPTEMPRGTAIDMKTMFGEDVILVHSSGVSVPTNEFGFLMQNLQHGESYYLVSKQAQA